MEDGQQSNHVLPKKPKLLEHVLQPVRPLSAFMWFMMDRRKESQSEKPELAVKYATKNCSNLWKNIDDNEREKYLNIARKDKRRFDDEFDNLLNLGYFIMLDGSKSSEHLRIIKNKDID